MKNHVKFSFISIFYLFGFSITIYRPTRMLPIL